MTMRAAPSLQATDDGLDEQFADRHDCGWHYPNRIGWWVGPGWVYMECAGCGWWRWEAP